MNTKRISGFQWAMTIFVFFVIAYFSPVILKDLQRYAPYKSFVFDLSSIAPFLAAFVCLLIFKNKATQLAGLKLTLSLKVIERILIAFTLPLIIYVICMWVFNTYSDSFIILQAKDLSVSIVTILIGHIIMAFLIEFGFRSYLQNMVETKVNTFFASIIVGLLYTLWNINTTYGQEYTMYNVLYLFSFSMIIGELIRATKGRSIYIAVIFHTLMSYAQIFFFSEETGDIFSMKVIALATAGVGIVYITLSLLIRAIAYLFTRRSLSEIEGDEAEDDEAKHDGTTMTAHETVVEDDVVEPTHDNDTQQDVPPVTEDVTHTQNTTVTSDSEAHTDTPVQENDAHPASSKDPNHPNRR